MKQYDPHRGWVDVEESNRADAAGAGAVAGALQNGSAPTDAGKGTVFHFSRDGRRLKVKNDECGTAESFAVTASTADASVHLWSGAGSLLAASGAVAELFETLSEDEKLSPQLGELVESMRCLAAKLEEKKRLEEELVAVTAQIGIVEQVLQRHVREARDSEIKALVIRQTRVDLIDELAACILDEKGVRKP